jgi:ABC-type proline/glycine betaine transport system permease subunit
MSGPHAAALRLLAHPAAPCAEGLQLAVVLVPDGAGWRLRYTLTGDLNALAIPAPLPPGPADGLWQHTCFEAFVGTAGSAAYREFNFSPSGQWAAYRFSAERARDPAAERNSPPPAITCERSADTLDLQVWLPPALLPEPEHDALLKIGLIAQPLKLIYTDIAIFIGMSYVYLPLMVLPLFAAIDRFDMRLLEAGYDLYASRWQILRKIILPIVKPGIIAGSILVFVPSLGAYVTPRVLGGGKQMMIGNLIELQFGQGKNWPLGAALSLTLLLIVTVALLYYVPVANGEKKHG